MSMTKTQIITTPRPAEYRRPFWFAGALLLLLFIGVGVVGYFYEHELRVLTEWVAQKIGFWGLALILFVSDTVVSPVPPDLLLLIVAKSQLRELWWFYVSVLAVVSTLGGHAGWWLGKQLATHPAWPKTIKSLPLKQKDFVAKYGFWAIVLGAATPLPFSITCWSAGFLNMKWQIFALASLFRIPRIVLYYLVIHYSEVVETLIKSLT